eukprot:COSAG02_NODE_59489_length_274_cov_0.594286_1_plen_51_part_01
MTRWDCECECECDYCMSGPVLPWVECARLYKMKKAFSIHAPLEHIWPSTAQ